MPAVKPTITLIGCGKMGSALLRGWLDSGTANHIFVIEPSGLPDEFKNYSEVSLAASLPSCDAFVLAIKPQIMKEICLSLNPPSGTLALSIAAGQKIAEFEGYFGPKTPVVRAMPNTPAAIGQGISVAIANAAVSPAQRDLADRLLAAAGQTAWVDDESLMDAVTALSGSGPAYVFYLIEVLARAGENAGLTADLAIRLARQTVIGASALAAAMPKTDIQTLRMNVTSPGGTTAAALEILMRDDRLQSLFTEALATATARSRALSGAPGPADKQ